MPIVILTLPLGLGVTGTNWCSQRSGDMEIIRNPDGSLVVPIPEGRHHDSDDAPGASNPDSAEGVAEPTTRLLHPGEGGYSEALAEWDLQQDPDRAPAVSTASGREEAMNVVHTVAESSDHDV